MILYIKKILIQFPKNLAKDLIGIVENEMEVEMRMEIPQNLMRNFGRKENVMKVGTKTICP